LIDAPALIERILRHLFLLQLLFGFAGFPSRLQVSVLSLRIQRKAISWINASRIAASGRDPRFR
jgi:hypothetical protein